MERTISRETLLHQLNWRYATSEFDPDRKISQEDWSALEQSLVLTPSSFGLQPWKFIVVTDRALRERLVEVSYGQRKVADSSHLVVFAIKRKLGEEEIDAYLERIMQVRTVSGESLAGYRTMLVSTITRMNEQERQAWASRQVYIALGNFLNSAALLGVDAAPMEGFAPEKYDQILGLDKDGLSAVVIAAAGYRSATDKYATLPKVRFGREEMIAHM